MTISNSYNFEMNRDAVIKGALRKLGVIAQGQTPDSSQYTDSAESLNVLIKSWQADGLPLWAIKTKSFTPVSGTNTYAVGTGLTVDTQEPLKIYNAWYRNTTSGIDVPIDMITQSQYDMLPNKSQTGTVTQMYYERLNGNGNLYTWLTPDTTFAASNTIYIRFQRPFADFDATADTPDFPSEWNRALIYGLAAELSFDFGFPKKDRDDMYGLAEKFKIEALAFSQEEGSFYFQPQSEWSGE
jgi:hypothetical protein